PDYDRSVLSLTNSVLAHYGIPPYHKTMPALDRMLEKPYRNIVFMIFDGMGSHILQKHLDPDAFLRTHTAADISSVFPPTTTASTVSMYTGLSPIEHGWLGWSLYFSEIDKNVNLFPNTLEGTQNTPAADFDVAQRYIPYEDIFGKINARHPDVAAACIAPFTEHRVNSVTEICDTVQKICGEAGRHFLLTYWPEPDGAMHLHGTQSEQARIIITDIDKQIEIVSEQLSDTLLIITADHGQMDTEFRFLTDYPALAECLLRAPSIEARAVNFFVREEKKPLFEIEFDRCFGNDFMLLTKEQVLERHLFGEGIPHKKAEDFLGDYLAVATGNIGIEYARPTWRAVFKGHHAGLTEEEMQVPLILIEKP
ncbi:MAG: alkaline phosphatase family protein, partial [Oscillospiraceae bacterium]|nr:alkaline phosphatase family protein [Oscillospiraceae bacterium]